MVRKLSRIGWTLALVVWMLPGASQADIIGLTVDLNGVSSNAPRTDTGLEAGAHLQLGLLNLGPISAGLGARLAVGGADPTLYGHGSVGGFVALDGPLHLSAGLRVGGMTVDYPRLTLIGAPAAGPSGTGGMVSADLQGTVSLLGPVALGVRAGYDRAFIEGEELAHTTFGLVFGLRI